MDDFTAAVKRSLEARTSGNGTQSDATILRALGKVAPNTPPWLSKTVLKSIDRASRTPRRFSEISLDLVSELSRTDFRSAGARDWLALRNILIQHGFLEASGIVRDNARKTALLLAENPKMHRNEQVQLNALQASLDLGDPGLAGHFRTRIPNSEGLRPLDLYAFMCLGHRQQHAPRQEGSNPVVDRFAELVRDASVAIVGPAPSAFGNGTEIDEFDVVVRPNYWGQDRVPDPREYGRRTDASYYNFAMGKRVTHSPQAAPFLGDLKCAVFKNPDHVPDSAVARAARLPVLAFLVGHANMVPIILFDLLHFGPKRLKLFGVNFFLSERSHTDGYVSVPKSGRVMLASLADHDLCSQRNFVRNLHLAGLVEGDEAATRVLEMDEQEYLRGMEAIYASA